MDGPLITRYIESRSKDAPDSAFAAVSYSYRPDAYGRVYMSDAVCQLGNDDLGGLVKIYANSISLDTDGPLPKDTGLPGFSKFGESTEEDETGYKQVTDYYVRSDRIDLVVMAVRPNRNAIVSLVPKREINRIDMIESSYYSVISDGKLHIIKYSADYMPNKSDDCDHGIQYWAKAFFSDYIDALSFIEKIFPGYDKTPDELDLVI